MVEAARPSALPPGSTIGILGSGQLGRMLAMAAARLGLKTHIYCEESGPAFDVATRTTKAAFNDETALTAFAHTVDVVTYEFENVAVATAHVLARTVPVQPSAKALEVAQDRLTEKEFIAALSIPVAPFRAVDTLDDLQRGPSPLRRTVHLEDAAARVRRQRPGQPAAGRQRRRGVGCHRGKPSVLERRVAFACEISTLVVRGHTGDIACYDSPANTHENGILRRSVVPCGLPEADLERAREIGGRIANALDYVGVLAVEMFYLGADAPASQRLMVNEIAPRVHNSGHWTLEACAVSQFENHMRAVAGWPLGSTKRHSDAEMVNLIGREALDWQNLAAEPDACLHLYGKRGARDGRKMGHVTRLFPIHHRDPT